MLFIKVGILFCMLSVIIGAFGAHALKDVIDNKMDTFDTGIQYQFFHGIALMLTGILSINMPDIDLNVVGYLFIVGIILFSTSLYLIAIYKYTFLGIVAPFGGLSFIMAWAFLLYKIGG